jgi:hypothetical protein
MVSLVLRQLLLVPSVLLPAQSWLSLLLLLLTWVSPLSAAL